MIQPIHVDFIPLLEYEVFTRIDYLRLTQEPYGNPRLENGED